MAAVEREEEAIAARLAAREESEGRTLSVVRAVEEIAEEIRSKGLDRLTPQERAEVLAMLGVRVTLRPDRRSELRLSVPVARGAKRAPDRTRTCATGSGGRCSIR
jgi:hypothetical protein